MNKDEIIPHLFRTEFTKITSVLCKLLHIENISIAEDIASDTFLSAIEIWTYNGIPTNPTAWLYAVAKNKAKNYIHRESIFKNKIIVKLDGKEKDFPLDIDWSLENIKDSQLQMLFAICHPVISIEAQVGLALRILCGFGIEEIADAFLSNKETINKRLHRAKEKLREANVPIEFPGTHEMKDRCRTVLTTLYLLFNEGYYSESNNEVLREDLCLEAMRLLNMLIENEPTNSPPANALLALMCFHASRFPARKNERGEMVLYHDQNESLWDQTLIAKGIYFLNQASQGDELSTFHLEASIAYWHTIKSDTPEKWNNILQLYNHLLQIQYSAIAALNRAYALSKVKGIPQAIFEAEKLQLIENHYYFTLLGVLYKDIDREKAKENLLKALQLAKTISDKNSIQAIINRQ